MELGYIGLGAMGGASVSGGPRGTDAGTITGGTWVHAYLHRVDGVLSNACHWYRHADKPTSATPLNEEWVALTRVVAMRVRS